MIHPMPTAGHESIKVRSAGSQGVVGERLRHGIINGGIMSKLPSLVFGVGAAMAVLPGLQAVAGAGGVAAAEERIVEEIVVTARKREETLQDVPFSVQAITGDDLMQRGATSLEDAANNVAGFTVQNLGPGQSQIAIRGISAGQIVRDQPGVKEQVGVYLDESVISMSLFTPDLDFYDMNRIEVLRGPQGTLYGSGSLSGTVKYVSNAPRLQVTEGAYQIGFNQISDGGFGTETKGMLNLPHGDNLALRLVGYNTVYGGWVDAVQPGEITVDDVNNGVRSGIRASLKYAPSDRLTLTPRIIYQKVDMNGFNREDRFNTLANSFTTTRPQIAPAENQQYIQLQENFVDEFLLLDNVLDFEFDSMTLTSITSFTDRDVLVLRDASALTLGVVGLIGESALGLDAETVDQVIESLDGPLYDTTSVQMITQELRLTSTGSGPLNWVVGLFYSDVDRKYGQDLPVTGFEALTGVDTVGQINPKDSLFYSQIPYSFEQKALFGELSYWLTDAMEITAGARWYDFKETRELNFDGIFASQSIGVPGETSSDGINPRLMLSYDFSEATQVNAQVARGFRLGGINDPVNEGACSEEDFNTFSPFASRFDDEELTNYEVGVKTRLFGGTMNAAVFYSDIENLQVTLDAGTCSSRIVYPVANASALGLEFEFEAFVTNSLSIAAAGSFVDTSIDSTLTSGGEVLGGVRDGNRFATTPELQLAIAATYDFAWSNDWDGFAVLSAQHVGSRYTQLADQEPGAGHTDPSITGIGDAPSVDIFVDPELPDYQIVNVRVGGRRGSWELAAFVNNLLDEQALQSYDRELGGVARFGYRVNQPLTVGTSLNYFFE